MTIEHQQICKSMMLEYYKPNERIVSQGDPGNSFFYILTGIVKIIVLKNYDLGFDNEQSKVTVEVNIAFLKLEIHRRP